MSIVHILVMTDQSKFSDKRQAEEKALKKKSDQYLYAGRWSSIGIQFIVSALVGYWIGQWIDTKFDTAPWFLVIGICLGLTAAFVDMVVLIQKSARLLKDDDEPSDKS